jgi:hypothetical protein
MSNVITMATCFDPQSGHHQASTITSLKILAVIPHPPYSPDLTPCDFFLFPKIKLKLKGPRFDTIEEIQAESQRVLDSVTEKDFQEAFQNWETAGPVSTCRRELLRG